MYKIWTESEIEKLVYLYCEKGLGAIEIVSFLNRSLTGIYLKIKKLKIRHRKDQTKALKSRLKLGSKNGMFGKKSPNKGLNKNNCERIRRAGKKISEIRKKQYAEGLLDTSGKKNGMYGKESWKKGQTKENNEKVRMASLKASETKKRQWQQLPEEEKERRRKRWGLEGLRCPKKDTLIEKKVKIILDNLHVKYEPHKNIYRWIVDFFIQNNKVIECFGDYWHCNPSKYENRKLTISQIKNKKRDKEKIDYFKKNKIPYMILWEENILRDKVKLDIENFCK